MSKSSSEASSSSSTMVHLRRNEAAASDGENRLSTIGKKQILLIGLMLDPVHILAILTYIQIALTLCGFTMCVSQFVRLVENEP